MGSGKKSARRDRERDVLQGLAVEAYRRWVRTGEDLSRARQVYAAAELISGEFEIRIPNEAQVERIAELEEQHEFMRRLPAMRRKAPQWPGQRPEGR